MITDDERRNVAANIRSAANRRKNDLQDDPDYSPFAALYAVFCGVRGWPHYEDLLHLADLIDRPTCLDLVEHKQDPFIPGKRMVDGYFHCSDCGWDGQIWEYIGFGDMLAYEAVHCPKCGAIIERRARGGPRRLVWWSKQTEREGVCEWRVGHL